MHARAAARSSVDEFARDALAEEQVDVAFGFPPVTWGNAAQMRMLYPVRVPQMLEPGDYRLSISLLDGGGSTLSLPIEIVADERSYTVPELSLPLDADFGGQVWLRGSVEALPAQLTAGASLPLTLVWQANGPTDADLSVAQYGGKTIILPVQRVQMGFGVRTSWLEKTGETFPATWDDVKRIAVKFGADDPDGNGSDDTFGLALEAAKPRDLIHMLDLFTFGAGLRHTLVDPDGNVVIDDPEHAEVLKEFLKTFTEYDFVAPDTINHSFGEMYQVIEGGRAGMFRVGDWNVKKWDSEALNGDFQVGPWPAFFADKESAVVIGGMRGVAVPENSPNKDMAVEFAKSLLSKPAQQASLEFVGAAVRKDLDISDLSERRQYFAAAKGHLNAYDFPEASLPYYPELEAEFHRRLLDAIANPPSDWDAFIKETAEAMRDEVERLKEG